MDKKAIFVLVVAMLLLILKLGVTGAQTPYERSIDFGQLFCGDDCYDEDLDDMGNALCESVFLGDKDCWASGICAAASQEGSQSAITGLENTEGILVTLDEDGSLMVGAQLSAGRSPPIRTFDEDGNEQWIRYYKVEYELRDRMDGEDTTYSIILSSNTNGITATPVDDEVLVDGNTTSYLGTNRIVFAAAGEYDGILMTFSPEMRTHGIWGPEDYSSLHPDNVPVVIANEGSTTTSGYSGVTPIDWVGLP